MVARLLNYFTNLFNRKPVQSLVVNIIKAAAMYSLFKILAVSGGPASLASFANFQNIIGTMLILVTLSLQTGLTIETAKAVNKVDALAFSLKCVLILTPLTFIFFYYSLDLFILESDEISAHTYFLGTSLMILPFAANSLLVAFEVGRQEYRKIFVNYCLVGGIPIVSGLVGYSSPVMSIIVGMCVANWLGAIYLFWNTPLILRSKSPLRVDGQLGMSMLRYGVVSGVIGITTAVTSFLIRSKLSDGVGIDTAGYWEALFKLGSLFQFAIVAPITSTALPIMVNTLQSGRRHVVALTLGRLRVLTALSIPALLISFLVADWIIIIIFSDKFLPIASLLPLMILSEFIRAIGAVLIIGPMANRKVSMVMLTYVLSTGILWLGLAYIEVLGYLGIEGVVLLYLAVCIVHTGSILLWTYFWFRNIPTQ